MTYEDFTTYTEVDAEGTITVAAQQVSYQPVERNMESYVYKDEGVGQFGNYEHHIDFMEGGGTTAHSGIMGIWGVSNSIDDFNGWSEGQQIWLTWDNTGGKLNVYLQEKSDATYDSWNGGAKATRYYLINERSGTTGTCKIYSDAAHTTLLDTLTLTVPSTTYRYVYAGGARNTGNNGYNFYGYTYNLDLNYNKPFDTVEITDSIQADIKYQYEDFASYTETDPDSAIAIVPSILTINDLDRDKDAYVYYDKGAGHFGNFVHYVDVKESGSTSTTQSFAVCWGLNNTVNDFYPSGAGNEAIDVAVKVLASDLEIRLQDRGSDVSDSILTLSHNTRYYLKMERTGLTTLTCKIYSDSTHTTLLDTLTITCQNNTYRYVYGLSSYNTGSSNYNYDGFVYNLDLCESIQSDTVDITDSVVAELNPELTHSSSDTVDIADSLTTNFLEYSKSDSFDINDSPILSELIPIASQFDIIDSPIVSFEIKYSTSDSLEINDSTQLLIDLLIDDTVEITDSLVVSETFNIAQLDTFSIIGELRLGTDPYEYYINRQDNLDITDEYNLWADPSYFNRKKLTIDSADVDGDLTDFPMLVSVTDNDLRDVNNGGHVRSSDGYDIVFYDQYGNLLDHEIESYINTSGTLVYWVKVPSVSGTVDSNIWMYYGKNGVTVNPSTTGAWNTDYKAVYHMTDDPDSSHIKDSTQYGNNGTKFAADIPKQVDGLIYKGQESQSTRAEAINCGHDSSLDMTEVTMETWIKMTYELDTGYYSLWKKNAYSINLYSEPSWSPGLKDAYQGYARAGGASNYSGTYVMNDYGTWHHVVVTAKNGEGVKLYIDGILRKTGTALTADMDTSAYDLYLCYCDMVTNNDEMRISAKCHPIEYIKACYDNQKENSTFITYGTEEYSSYYDMDNTFDITDSQIVAPGWLPTDQFDIDDSYGLQLEHKCSIFGQFDISDSKMLSIGVNIDDLFDITDGLFISESTGSSDTVDITDSVVASTDAPYSTDDTFNISDLPLPEIHGIYEDIQTFAEFDSASYITVTNNLKCTGNQMRMNATAYLYKDYGTGFFDDFEHYHEAKMVGLAATASCYGGIWGISNSIGDSVDWQTNGEGLCVYVNTGSGPDSGKPRFTLSERTSVATYDSSIKLVKDTMYYLKTKRDGTTATVKIYSDASKTTLLDTLSLAVNTQAYRYLYSAVSRDNGTNIKYISFESNKLDIREKIEIEDSFDITDFVTCSQDYDTSDTFDITDTISGIWEDFTTYTEVDPDSDIAVAAHTIDYQPVRDDNDSYVYKDYGEGRFGNYTHYIDFEEGGGFTNFGITAGIWGVTNSVDDFNNWTDGQQVIARKDTYPFIRLVDKGNSNYDAYTGFIDGTRYYLKNERNGTTVICKIYSDAARTTLLDTLSITSQDTTYRYIYAGGSNNTGGTSNFKFYLHTYNLDLGIILHNPSDTFGIADSAFFPNLFTSDTFDITDLIVIASTHNISDSFNISDSCVLTHEVILDDLFSINDSQSNYLNIECLFDDSIDIIDSKYIHDKIPIDELIDIDDSYICNEETYISDQFDIFDIITVADGILVYDDLTISDLLDFYQSFTVYDQFDVDDSLSEYWEWQCSIDDILDIYDDFTSVHYMNYPALDTLDIIDSYDSYIYGGDIDVYYQMELDPNSPYISCWCGGWSRNDYELTVTLLLSKEDRDLIMANTYSGAVTELFNVLGEKYFVDTTWQKKNTLKLIPFGMFGKSNLPNMYDETLIGVKSISYEYVSHEWWSVKIIGIIL